MALSIVLAALKSRQARTAIAGSTGVRRFATGASKQVQPEAGGVVKFIYDGFSRFGGFLINNIKGFLSSFGQIDFKSIFAQIVKGTFFLLNFNWNITDAQLDEQIKQAEIGLYGAAGATVGSGLGYLICGGIPAAAIAVFNKPLAIQVLQDLGEEAGEEIAGQLSNLVRLLAQQAIRITFISIFKNYRNLLRGAAIGFAKVLASTGLLTKEYVDNADKKRNEPWTFAEAIQERVEAVKDPKWENFYEELLEEFGEACIEAGYIVASTVDSYFAQQKLANDMYFGQEKTIEILIDRDGETTVQTT